MKIGWPWRRRRDPVAQEVAEQAARSKVTLDRVERAIDRASAVIDDYNAADQARLARRNS